MENKSLSNKNYYEANRERLLEKGKEYRQAHKDEINAKRREKYHNGTYAATPYDSDIRHKYYTHQNPNAKRVPRLSDEEKATIVSMFDTGCSLYMISKETGRSFVGVRKYLRRIGKLEIS